MDNKEREREKDCYQAGYESQQNKNVKDTEAIIVDGVKAGICQVTGHAKAYGDGYVQGMKEDQAAYQKK